MCAVKFEMTCLLSDGSYRLANSCMHCGQHCYHRLKIALTPFLTANYYSAPKLRNYGKLRRLSPECAHARLTVIQGPVSSSAG